MSLDECLQSTTYEIVDELQIRKRLEAETEWRYEFTKGAKYGYDLKLYRWSETPDGPSDRHLFGYVELERATGWQKGAIPDGWHYYSFLRRKVHEFEGVGRWGDLKPNAERAVYLKFNRELDNCFVAPIKAIDEWGEETKRSDGRRENTYLKLPFDHPTVSVGINDAVSYIQRYLGSKLPIRDGGETDE
jgi:hypothetical protein